MSRIALCTVAYVIEMMIALSYLNRIFKRKHKIGYILLISSVVYFCGLLQFIFVNIEILNLITFCIINLIVMLLCYKCSLKSAVVQMILMSAFMAASEMIVIYLISAIMDVPLTFYRNDINTSVQLVLISKIIYFAALQLTAFIIKRGKKNIDSKRYIALFIFPAITLVTTVVFLIISIRYEISNSFKIVISAVLASYIFACVLILIYFQYLEENEAKVKELESERSFYELNNTYLDILQQKNDELQMLFHDTKNHYLALSAFDDISQVKDYINKIYPEFENKNTVRISNNKMLDLILNKYIFLCNKKNIKFTYEAKTANLDYIDDSELSIILNNILDNAVESAVKSREKVIDFSLRNINNMDILSVINSCDTPPVNKNGRLISTKPESANHGFGTRIIKKHAKFNNGRVEWHYDNQERRFHLSILFQRKIDKN